MRCSQYDHSAGLIFCTFSSSWSLSTASWQGMLMVWCFRQASEVLQWMWGSLAMWKRMPTAVLAKPPCCMQRGPEKGACIKVTLQNHQALASLLVKEPSLN
mmetsp:Transcript_25624/g.65971  ORF Transcript_25624/g.65971 Transcript_25624/m.65971 type:complete len:101 (-) Transcript_25624:561-863(-)